jgi:hypothetical protein
MFIIHLYTTHIVFAAEAQRIFTALSGMSRTEMLQKARQELDINKEQMDKAHNTHMGR